MSFWLLFLIAMAVILASKLSISHNSLAALHLIKLLANVQLETQI